MFLHFHNIQVFVLHGVVCEYSNNRSHKLHQQVGQKDLADGELAQ